MVAAAFLTAIIVMPASANPGAKSPAPEASAERLYGIPEGVDLKRIVGKPRLVSTDYFVFRDAASDERRLGGYVDIVAVYDIPMEYFLEASDDFASYPSFVPYIIEATILSKSDSTSRIRYHSGIKFLGISVSYDSIFEATVELAPDGSAMVGSRLVESLDDAEYEHYTSTYLCPVTIEGKTMTFVRYFNRPGIKRPSLGMLQVLNVFASGEGKRQVEAFADEAARRAASR